MWRKNADFLEIVQRHLNPDDFRVDVCREIFKLIVRCAESGERWDLLNPGINIPRARS